MVLHHNDADALDAAFMDAIGKQPPDDAEDWQLVAAAEDELTEEDEAANAAAEYLWEHRPLYRD